MNSRDAGHLRRHDANAAMGKFDWGGGGGGGGGYVIIFLYVQFLIRLAVVSYRGKKVRTVASPVVRSVNKPRDSRNCVR